MVVVEAAVSFLSLDTGQVSPVGTQMLPPHCFYPVGHASAYQFHLGALLTHNSVFNQFLKGTGS